MKKSKEMKSLYIDIYSKKLLIIACFKFFNNGIIKY